MALKLTANGYRIVCIYKGGGQGRGVKRNLRKGVRNVKKIQKWNQSQKHRRNISTEEEDQRKLF